jgi:hypothetical protein
MRYIKDFTLIDEIMIDDYNKVGFSPELGQHLFAVCVPYIENYYRYYYMMPSEYIEIMKGDYESIKEKYKDVFKHLLISPINEEPCYGTPIINSYRGSTSLRDYDVSRWFLKNAYSGMYDAPLHQGYLIYEDVMFAHIVFKKEHYAVLPRVIGKDVDGSWRYVLRNRKDVDTYRCESINFSGDYMTAIQVDDFEGYDEWERDYKKEPDEPDFIPSKTKFLEVEDGDELILVHYDEEMTWKDWIKSRYNVNEWYADNSEWPCTIRTNEGNLLVYMMHSAIIPVDADSKVNNPFRENIPLMIVRTTE